MKKQLDQTKPTRQKLFDAFWTSYQTKNIDKISIGEITRIAGYNRGTFYEYFTDIYDVLSQIEDELLSLISDEIDELFTNGLPETIAEYSFRYASVFKKYDDRIFILLGPSGDPHFQPKLQKIFLAKFVSLIRLPNDIPHMDYIQTFIFSSLVGMMTLWYDNGKDISEEEFIALMLKLVASGIMGYTNVQLFS